MARRLWLCRVASVQTLGLEALALAVWLWPGMPALLVWTFVLQVGCSIVGEWRRDQGFLFRTLP